MYKALYRLFGGFIADVVAAIDQVCYKLMVEKYKILSGCSNFFCVYVKILCV